MDFSRDELLAAKKRMHRRKAGGSDGIAHEFFMGVRDENGTRSAVDDYILVLLNSILSQRRYPEAWRLASLVALVKPGCNDVGCPRLLVTTEV